MSPPMRMMDMPPRVVVMFFMNIVTKAKAFSHQHQ